MAVHMKNSVAMRKLLIGKYNVQAHLIHQATYSLCVNNWRVLPWIQFSFLPNQRQCISYFKPSKRKWSSPNSILLFACMFFVYCVFNPGGLLLTSPARLLWLLPKALHQRAIKKATSKWTWQKSQGVVIWVDMQINISHHQPLVVGAQGQDDEIQPV